MTPAHIQPSSFGIPQIEWGCLCPAVLPSWAKCDSPQLPLSFLLDGRSLADHSQPFQHRRLAGNERLLHTAGLGQGHVLQLAIARAGFCLHPFIPLLVRGRSGLHRGPPRSENGKMLPEFNLISGTLIPQRLFRYPNGDSRVDIWSSGG